MRIFRATVLDTPDDPFTGGALRVDHDGGIAVEHDGIVCARGGFADVVRDYPDAEVVDLRPGLLLPGFVDTHVHLPQVRVIGALGMPLLDWLDKCALPEEARMADPAYARAVGAEILRGLVAAGTTSALVFGAHFRPAMEAFADAVHESGLRITTGLVVADRVLPESLLTTPQRAYDDAVALADAWADTGLRYAVTPRFSLSSSSELLDACGAVAYARPDVFVTSHVNENPVEVERVRELHGTDYVSTYEKYGLLGGSTVLAHNVHPSDDELRLLAARRTSVAHCPTSNSALGSGLFPLRRHRLAGVRVALGSDVGAGTGLSLLKEGLQAYFMQQLLGNQGEPLTAAHLLHLATAAGADALGLHQVGDLSVGKEFDAVWVSPRSDGVLAGALEHAKDAEDALAKVFALGTDADLGGVWIGGQVPLARHTLVP
ncbi:guanine deaminase [Calidifontibacter sp. DB0510]|uniref:Guanine deaminase n=1 Tax=Metallococcus carri TaxID=1656884 RepID=A0A967B1G5_9MICO|nr:guanine deaminase [Metallococcus carri]NHN57059.1 guanine deaminase [Metallococcus carri]NOP39072.1 guanine deaminase [Calidifontibacter sp. DB2511S]